MLITEDQNQPQTLTDEFLAEQARQLGHAAADGELGKIKSILGAYPAVVHARGGIMRSTLLHFAADRGYMDAAQLLIGAGADVNAREGATGTTPLHWAAASSHLDMAALLLRHGACLETTDDWHDLPPLAWAAALPAAPHAEMAHFLLAQGATPDIFSLMAFGDAAAVRGLVEAEPDSLCRSMNRLEDEHGALHYAVLRNLPEMVDALLSRGADIDAPTSWGLTPLCLAIGRGDTALADALIHHGATKTLPVLLALEQWEESKSKLSAQPELVGPNGPCSRLIHWAARDDRHQAASLLLRAGADPNVAGKQIIDELLCDITPLHRAATRGNEKVARVLLENDADPNRRSAGFWDVTPLQVAAWHGHAHIVRLLLERGADADIVDSHGIGTALDWAKSRGHDEVVTVLEARTSGGETV